MWRTITVILFAHLLFMPVSYLSQPPRYGPPCSEQFVEIDGPDDSMYFYPSIGYEDDVELDPSGGLFRLRKAPIDQQRRIILDDGAPI